MADRASATHWVVERRSKFSGEWRARDSFCCPEDLAYASCSRRFERDAHRTREEAEHEAVQLAEKHPDEKFRIVEWTIIVERRVP